jgi:sterol desaturase/sphingolipid hydroxylase (fatty acid hydroxylase superfamily)
MSGLVGLLPAIVFSLLVAAELACPRRAPAGPTGERWIGNMGLFLANGAFVLWLVPALVAWADPEPSETLQEMLPGGWLGAIGALLFLDLLSYAAHRLFHAVPPLWRLHSVHHTDIDLDVTTAVRHHPLEFAAIFAATALLAGAVGVSPATVALYGTVALAAQMLQHANVRLPGRVERLVGVLFVTPAFHRLHHSLAREDSETNFGTVLSLWDRLFGTARRRGAGDEPAGFGVAALSAPRYQRLHWMLLTPLC